MKLRLCVRPLYTTAALALVPALLHAGGPQSEARFLLPAMTRRDANADPLFDLFDFASPHFATPPALASSKVDAAGLTKCQTEFPGK